MTKWFLEGAKESFSEGLEKGKKELVLYLRKCRVGDELKLALKGGSSKAIEWYRYGVVAKSGISGAGLGFYLDTTGKPGTPFVPYVGELIFSQKELFTCQLSKRDADTVGKCKLGEAFEERKGY